jgi:hypothetical protein
MHDNKYLAHDKNYTCTDEHYYPSDYNYNKMNCGDYNWYCPYMHICPVMQHQNTHHEYPMKQTSKLGSSTKDNLNYREDSYENNFRHPYGHMSYNYHEGDDNYNHHHEDHHDDDSSYPYNYSDYYEHELSPFYQNPYYYQSPFMQYSLFPQLPYFEEDEEDDDEHEH